MVGSCSSDVEEHCRHSSSDLISYCLAFWNYYKHEFSIVL